MPDSFDNAQTPSQKKGRKGRFKPKGRLTDPAALRHVETLLSGATFQRDMLIEYLHIIQDEHGHLSAENLAALAHLMKIPMAEVWEVASFYDHFDLVKEGETAPAKRTIRICTSLSCMMAGGEAILAELQASAGDDVRFVPAPCIGACDKAPAAADGHNLVSHVTTDSLRARAAAPAPHHDSPDYIDFDAYVAQGGYQLLKALKSGIRQALILLVRYHRQPCAVWAVLVSQQGANGQLWLAMTARALWQLMAMRANLVHLKTGFTLQQTRIA